MKGRFRKAPPPATKNGGPWLSKKEIAERNARLPLVGTFSGQLWKLDENGVPDDAPVIVGKVAYRIWNASVVRTERRAKIQVLHVLEGDHAGFYVAGKAAMLLRFPYEVDEAQQAFFDDVRDAIVKLMRKEG